MTSREVDSDRREAGSDQREVGSDQREAAVEEGTDADRCATCGREIDPSDWHPVATRFTSDDGFRMLTFCSHDCRRAWTEE